MRMDVSHYLATESFSYSWLPSNPRLFPNEEEEEEEEAASQNSYNFDFDVSNSSNSSLVHADKLFSNGLIAPSSSSLHNSNPYSRRSEKVSYSSATSPGSVALFPSPNYRSVHVSQKHSSAGKLKRILQSFTPVRFLSKYMRCLIPVGGSRGRNGIRVDDVNRRSWEVKSYSNCNAPESAISPRRREIDESSIYEAIIYCKRSSGSSN